MWVLQSTYFLCFEIWEIRWLGTKQDAKAKEKKKNFLCKFVCYYDSEVFLYKFLYDVTTYLTLTNIIFQFAI